MLDKKMFQMPEGLEGEIERLQFLLDQAFPGRAGLILVSSDDAKVTGKVRFEKGLANLQGRLHGGVLFTIGDTLTGMLLVKHKEVQTGLKRPVTANSSIRFLRPVSGGEVVCVSRIVREAGQHIFLKSDFYNEEKKRVAQAKFTYALVPETRK